jgi:hypothetical protein
MNEEVVSLGLQLLDRQLVDVNDRECGKVDDIQLEFLEDPDSRGAPPVATHILTGPGALGSRLRGLPGRIANAAWKRLHPESNPQSIRLPFSLVSKLDYEVHLSVEYHSVGLEMIDDWVKDQVVGKIPGSS